MGEVDKGCSGTSAAPAAIVCLMSRLIFPSEWKHLAAVALQGHNLHLSVLFCRVVLVLLILFGHNLHVSVCLVILGLRSSFNTICMSSSFVFFLDTMTDWINVDMSL